MAEGQNKVALVTGGTSGIGLSTARRLRADGFRVAVMARHTPAPLAEEGFELLPGDVASESVMTEIMGEVELRFGRLDTLVHCAAIVENERAETISAESVRRQIDTNLIGTIFSNRAAIPLLKCNGGSIVNFSTGIVRLPVPGTSVYAATKAGVEAFSRSLAFEVAPMGVRVNVVAPSVVRSNIWLRAGMTQEAYDAMLKALGAEYPLGRTGEPEDVAAIVRFLVSAEAGWITGAVIPVDGGSTLGRIKAPRSA